MRTVCLCFVLFVVAGTVAGSKVFDKYKRTRVPISDNDEGAVVYNGVEATIFGIKRSAYASILGNKKRTDVNCNAYFPVSPRLRFSLGLNATRDVNTILVDNRVTKAEVTSALNSVCRSLSRTADAFEEDYLGCPNDVTIIQAMEHLGPMCLRSGNLSTFARNYFTEVTLTESCILIVMQANEMCGAYDDISEESAGYNQDLTVVRRVVRDRYQCVLERLNSAHDCGNIGDVKRAYLMLGSLMIIKPGLDYNMVDFF